MSYRTLFLHWGPGSHARVEANLLPRLFPSWDWSTYDFWDQPQSTADAPSPLSTLVDAASGRLMSLATNGPIHIVAHSSGGMIAAALSNRHPELISQITLLATNSNPPRCFLNFGEKLCINEKTLQNARDKFTHENFWSLVNEIATQPNFSNSYWGASSNLVRDMYFDEAEKHESLHFGTFQSVMNDFLNHPTNMSLSRFKGKVKLWVGKDDPLIQPDNEINEWKKIFPQLQTHIIPQVGHFIHFECDPASWLSEE